MLQQQGFLRFRIDACALQSLVIPDFGGSMLRGALGYALAHVDRLAYEKLFDTGLGHAFLITPPQAQQLNTGDVFTFYVTLFPSVIELHEILFRAMDLALRKGLSVAQIPCELLSYKEQPVEFSLLSNTFRVNLLSPWFVKFRGNPVIAKDFRLETFLISLTQRQRELVKRGYLRATLPSNQTLLDLAEKMNCSLHLYDVFGERRSNRQHIKHRLQGVSGHLEINSKNQESLQLLSPLLHRAQWLHGGSKVSFGQGALQVQTLNSPVSQLEELRQIAIGATL